MLPCPTKYLDKPYWQHEHICGAGVNGSVQRLENTVQQSLADGAACWFEEEVFEPGLPSLA